MDLGQRLVALRILRALASAAILLAAAGLLILFVVQLPHPARWDTLSVVVILTRWVGPLLEDLESRLGGGPWLAVGLAAALLVLRLALNHAVAALVTRGRRQLARRLEEQPAAAPLPAAPPPIDYEPTLADDATLDSGSASRDLEEMATLERHAVHIGQRTERGLRPLQVAPPRQFGRYEIVQELGRGAMGVVYKARDPSLGRIVAIKSMHHPAQLLASTSSEDAADKFVERFRQEARAVAGLHHRGIVGVHDFIQDDVGQLALVMEYVEGTTLEALAAQERPGVDQALDIAIQVAEALHYAHSRGVVHRDVKPANVLVAADGTAKVSDFGLAKLEGSSLTRTGEILGTPAFMSPEQFLGTPVDARSDLFSLGCVLYWLLTGERPFAGESITAIAFKVVNTPFTPARSLNPALPPGVDVVLARLLAKAPEARYQSGEQLANDLRALKAGQALAGAPA